MGPSTLDGGTIVDLSLPIEPGVQLSTMATSFETIISLEDRGFTASAFRMFAHSGTHVDAPVHYFAGGEGVDQVPLQALSGQGRVFDLRALGPDHQIGPDELSAADPGLRPDEFAVLQTGWTDEAWATPRFIPQSPWLTMDGVRWLAERGARAIACDFSPDYVTRVPEFRGEDCGVHLFCLDRDIRTIEFVTNLGALTTDAPWLLALPIKLVGLDGAPARVVAVEPAGVAS